MGQGFLVEKLSQMGGQLTTGNPGMLPPLTNEKCSEPLSQKRLDTMAGQSPGIGFSCFLRASVQ